jgi:hypothetical protein
MRYGLLATGFWRFAVTGGQSGQKPGAESR